MKIDELGLSARAYHVLQNAKINTVEQLREALSNPFVKVGSIGSSVFNELQEKIAAHTITNADRIRAMTDEELAKEFESMASYCAPGTYPNVEICRIERCVECWLDWLKRPAEEDTK